MYIRTPEMWGLADLPSAKPTAKSYRPPLTNGGEFIREEDADKVLTILSGPSPYQDYILPVMAVRATSQRPRNFLRIVSSPEEVPEHLRRRFVTINNKIVGGTIDRPAGTIYLLAPPGRRNDTRLEFALHEAVHLFAHPFMSLVDERTFRSSYGRGCTTETDVGTFQRKYCLGFGEGATQVITEQIMKAQGITKYKEDRPYKEFTPPVLELIRIFSIDRFARAYFWGAVNEFTQAMESRWGNAWRNVANFTSARDTKKALAWITRLELTRKLQEQGAEIRRRKLKGKGDFPTLSRSKKYA